MADFKSYDYNKEYAKKYLGQYDEIRIRVPKGEREKIKAHAIANGESMNSYIIRLIDEDMQGLKKTCDELAEILDELKKGE